MRLRIETLGVAMGFILGAMPAARTAAEPGEPPLQLSWTNNMLTVSGGSVLAGGEVKIWYLEAFCRPGGHDRDWSQTTIPHRTELISRSKDGRRIQLRTRVEPAVVVLHDIRAR